jgi:hypothetical protein
MVLRGWLSDLLRQFVGLVLKLWAIARRNILAVTLEDYRTKIK